jgi:hypothetical protein
MLIYTATYSLYYKNRNGSMMPSIDNPLSIKVKSNTAIEDNIFKKYLENIGKYEVELLNVCYEDTDKMISYDDIQKLI